MLIFLMLLVTALYDLALAVILLVQTTHHQRGRNFAFFLLGYAAWIFCGALLYHPMIGRQEALWVARSAFFFDTCYTVGWLWFALDFPRPAPPRYRSMVMVATLLGLPWALLTWSNLLVSDMTASPWVVNIHLGRLALLYACWIIPCGLGGCLLLLGNMRGARGIERAQVHYTILGFLPWIIIAGTCNLLFPAMHVTQWMPLGLLASVLPSTLLTYAIIRHRFAGIKFLLRSGIVYSITLGILLLLFTILVPVLGIAISAHYGLATRTLHFLLMAGLAMLFYPTQQLLKTFIDKRFFKSIYDYRTTLRDAGKAFAAVRDIQTLINRLQDTLLRTLRPVALAIYLPDNQGALVCTASQGTWRSLPERLTLDEPILVYARQANEIMPMEEYLRQDGALQQWGEQLQQWDVYLGVPLISGDRLCGLLCLGEKSFGEPYTTEDIEFLHILSSQVSVSLDNACHYDALRQLNADLELRVSERTQQLATAVAHLEAAIELLPLPMVFLAGTPERPQVLRQNSALRELLGDGSALCTPKALQFLSPHSRMPIPMPDWPSTCALRGEPVPCHELALVLDSDREIPVLVHAAPIFVNEQQVGAVIAFQDISQLKADDRAKDDFLAVLSHELMTPLTCILGWGEVGLAHNTPEIIRQSLDVIVRNAQRQRRLITDLLDVSRIIHDKLSIQSTPLDLWQLTMQAIDQLQPPLRDRQLTLVRCPPQASALPVMADPDRMLQVINNLLNNAIKHTPAGGTITVTGSAEDGWAYVEIADTGQGLASELLSRIFLPFQQGEQYEANTGLGLGLALVRGIVELHGGRATAKSAGIGQGSAFTVALPLLTAPAAACTSLSTTGATRESVLN